MPKGSSKMQHFRDQVIGIDQGEVVLFSDCDTNGEMWSGTGTRERSQRIAFSEPFATAPTVSVALTMWDIAKTSNIRADLRAEEVTTHDFQLIFRTWEDTQVARVRVRWQAFGALPSDDIWAV